MSVTVQQLYGYTPSSAITLLFVVLFGISFLAHCAQAIYFRLWFLLPTAALAALGEIIGWAARYISSRKPHNVHAFLAQVVTIIISPTPLVAANFVVLGSIMIVLGSQYSRLTPSKYTAIFCSIDVVALFIQALGGAVASRAVEKGKDPNKPGGHVMLAGIVFQLVSLIVYVSLAAEFLWRWHNDKPYKNRKQLPGGTLEQTSGSGTRTFPRKIKLMIGGLGASTLFVFIRNVYRTIALSEGFSSSVNHTQVLFDTLDGMMIVLALFSINFIHPGWNVSPFLTSSAAAHGVTPQGQTVPQSQSNDKYPA